MRGMILLLSLLGLCVLVPACRSMEPDMAVVNRLTATASGNIIYQSIKRHGLPGWSGTPCMEFTMRTEERAGTDTVRTSGKYMCDTRTHQVKAVLGEGELSQVRVFSEGTYWETQDSTKVTDPDLLLIGRSALLGDYVFTTLACLAASLPVTFTSDSGPSMENIGGVTYYVIELSFDTGAPLAPNPWYRLYYASSSHRLEKVFFQGREGSLKGKYIWCEFENFQLVDGIFFPHYREFTLAEDRKGRKWTGLEPFVKQWMQDAELSGSLDEGTFSP